MEQIPEASLSRNQIGDPRRAILVVDDETPMLRLLEGTFSEHGYTVFTAADGEEAIKNYCRHKSEIDVVFLDVGLPKVKGADVLHKIKGENPAVRVVVSSGFFEPELRTEMQRAGVEHFIEKPYMLDDVVKTIQNIIELAEALSER